MFVTYIPTTPLNLILLLISLSLLYLGVLLFHRLYLSPLSKFPGPKIAAATLWTEFYYDAVLRGQFQFKVREWHEIYGMLLEKRPGKEEELMTL
jgi:hypothetical protein